MSENNNATAEHPSPVACKVDLSDSELNSLGGADLLKKWREQDSYISSLERRLAQQEGEIAAIKESEDRLKQQHAESQQREKILVQRLAAKEQEMQDLACQVAELKASQIPNAAALRNALLDPAVNLLLQQLRQELIATKSRLEETQNELSAWKFTPDSNTGKRLMAKCRLLHQENEELGKVVSSGRIAKLEGELALQKSFSEEMKKSQLELDEFLQELDEDVEGMQSTIYLLQQELRKSKEQLVQLQAENAQLKSARINGTSASSDVCPVVRQAEKRTYPSSDSETPESVVVNSTTTNSPPPVVEQSENNSIEEEAEDASRTPRHKKVRRSSVLSLDINDDDALVISTNGEAD